jgi:hypothetical protein
VAATPDNLLALLMPGESESLAGNDLAEQASES